MIDDVDPAVSEADERKRLLAFLTAVENTQEIDEIYTQSSHGTLACEIMNDCLAEHPEWKNALQMLAVHPVQQWAASERTLLHIDTASVEQAIHDEASYFGIDAACSMNTQKEVLIATDQALTIIKNAINRENDSKDQHIIQALHGVGYDDVSKYMVRTGYEHALKMTCEEIAKPINKVLAPISKQLEASDEEAQIAYHDANLLIHLGPVLWDESYRRHYSVDYEEAAQQIKECINSLKKYPFNGADMYRITWLFFKGYTDYQIEKEIERSRTYIRGKYKESVKAISYLIWGYATKAILTKHK